MTTKFILISFITILSVRIAAQPAVLEDSGNDASFQIDADFPGGNIKVIDIHGDSVRLQQDLRDTEGHWFYWSFRVRGAAGRKLNFEFTNGSVISSRGPAVSTDGGLSWRWIGELDFPDTAFQYDFGPDEDEVFFGQGMNYTEKDLHRFLNKHNNHPDLAIETLCTSRKGRNVELIRIQNSHRTPDYKIVLLSRSHSGEMMATRALEGLIEHVLSDTEDGRWLRNHADFFIVPFVDKDGVEDGDQGKNRRPHDHNRDYIQHIYPEISALVERVPEWLDHKPLFFLDMHCPMHRRGRDECVHFSSHNSSMPDFEEKDKKLRQFGTMLRTEKKGAIPKEVIFISPNIKTESDKIALNLQNSQDWASTLPNFILSATLEVPFANASGDVVDAITAHELGYDVAHAIRVFLEN